MFDADGNKLFLLKIAHILASSLPGIANAIDLADRFLPKLQSLNCEYFSKLPLCWVYRFSFCSSSPMIQHICCVLY